MLHFNFRTFDSKLNQHSEVLLECYCYATWLGPLNQSVPTSSSTLPWSWCGTFYGWHCFWIALK